MNDFFSRQEPVRNGFGEMGGSRFPSLHDCTKRPEAENKILTIVFNIVKIYNIHHSHVQYTQTHTHNYIIHTCGTGGYVRTKYDERATINRTALGRVVAIYITAYSVETQMDGTNNIIIIIAETIVCLDGGYTRFYFIFG